MAKDAEAVMDAIQTVLVAYSTGLWTTVAVDRDLENQPWEEDELPALNLIQGSEYPKILGSTLQDNELTVVISGYAMDDGITDPKDVVNRMSRQIQTALFDPWYSGGDLLGLSYAWNIEILENGSAPIGQGGGVDKASKSTTFNVTYRTEHQDLGG